jgi:putative DNA primase/helicase
MSDDKIVNFPISSEERDRRLKAEVERQARLPSFERILYLEDTAAKYGIEAAKFKAMVDAEIRANEKKERKEKAERQRIERRAEKQRDTAKRDEEHKQEREEREARKEVERKDREKQKAFEAIVKLPSAEHESRLAALARQLGEDLDVLREEFAELRIEEEERIKRGEVEPWDEPVNTRELLNAVTAQFEKYIIVHDRVIAPIVPLWTAFEWVHDDIATFSPILIFQGGDTEMAKSAASEVVSHMSPRAFIIVEPTGPAFYRFVDRVHPALFLDDADKLLPRRPDLAHIVNSSWKRGTYIPRTDAHGVVHLFDAFGPRCLNGIDLLAHLAPATRTRCITIDMLPLLEEEKDRIISMRYAADDENFVILRRKLLRWATDNMAALKSAKPRMPDGFFGRLEENYHLLFAIADLAGGDWPKRARVAAIKASREHNRPSLGKRLLAIMFDLSIRHGTLQTSKWLEQVVPTEDDEFANYRGRPINMYQIAALLKPYCNIQPKPIHPRGRKTSDRGYDTTWPEFTLAFKHYLGKSLPLGRSVVSRQNPTRR